MITRLIWTKWTLTSADWERLLNLITHSLTGEDIVWVSHQSFSDATASLVDPQLAPWPLDGVVADTTTADSPGVLSGFCEDIMSNTGDWNLVFFMLTWSPLLSMPPIHTLNLEDTLLLGVWVLQSSQNSIFSCNQAALWMVQSIRLFVSPSACLSHLFHYVANIYSSWNFQELLPMTEVMSIQKVKVAEVKTPFIPFRAVTPVWIHIWWWNDAQSLMLLRRGALLLFKVIHQISRSRG